MCYDTFFLIMVIDFEQNSQRPIVERLYCVPGLHNYFTYYVNVSDNKNHLIPNWASMYAHRRMWAILVLNFRSS